MASDGTPAGTGNSVVISGGQQTVEGRQCFAERRIAQIVAETAEFAEGRSVVARKRLFVVTADVGGRRRLDETRHVHVVESLSQRASQASE